VTYSNLLNLISFSSLEYFLFLFTIFLLIVVIIVLKQNSLKNSEQMNSFYQNLREEIQFSIKPEYLQLSLSTQDLVELAVEIWRTEQRVLKFWASLSESQQKGLENSIQKLKRYIEKYDIEIIDYTNQKFNDGLSLDVLSVEKDPSVVEPIIKETIEPTVICKGQVVKKAKVIVLRN